MIVSPHIEAQLAQQHQRGLRAAAARRLSRRRTASEASAAIPAGEVVIRRALPSDRGAVARLAEIDGKHLPGGALLLAEVEGEPQAALSLDRRTVVADPFRPTAALVSLLTVRADQLAA
jgi:hypothetical protein